MSKIMLIPYDEHQKPGTWMSLGKGIVLFTCPNCGTIGTFDHEIAPDGTVTPSVVCPDCEFHEWLKLDDWGER